MPLPHPRPHSHLGSRNAIEGRRRRHAAVLRRAERQRAAHAEAHRPHLQGRPRGQRGSSNTLSSCAAPPPAPGPDRAPCAPHASL